MDDPEYIAQQEEMLLTLRRRLAYHNHQRVQLGVIAPFSLLEDIRAAYEEIARVKASLRANGVAVEDLADDAPPASTPGSASEQASAGLTAMAELLSAPDMRAALAGFKESFEVICQQIDRLSSYKELHDLLHDLQFNCYNPITRGAKDFPNNELFLESLVDYETELRQIAYNLAEVVERAEFLSRERIWVEQVGQAADLLREASQHTSKPELDRATFQVGRVLYVHPARINERLKEAARDLPLVSLIKAMQVVKQHPVHANLASEKLPQIEQGVTAIEHLHESLSRLIAEHDTWQEIELELHRVEDDLAQHVQELIWLWPDLKARLDPLCNGRPDRWTQDMLSTGERFDQALATQQTPAIVAAFRPMRRQAGLCFFQADKKLKELCRSLRRVDGPLNAVLSVIV